MMFTVMNFMLNCSRIRSAIRPSLPNAQPKSEHGAMGWMWFTVRPDQSDELESFRCLENFDTRGWRGNELDLEGDATRQHDEDATEGGPGG